MAQRRRRTKPKRNSEAPGWVWMLFGLAIGLAVALGIYVNANSDRDATAAATATPSSTPEVLSTGSGDGARPAEEPDPQQVPESRFDFYELLPRFEVVIPEVEAPERQRLRDEVVEEPGLYVLQAGSFRAIADADRRKASLALLGIESRIQTVAIDDATFHRVRIGPIDDLDELNQYRRRLLDAGVETLMLRLPP
jgi:cell division protein FtsN